MPHMTRAAAEMLALHRLSAKQQRTDVTYTFHSLPTARPSTPPTPPAAPPVTGPSIPPATDVSTDLTDLSNSGSKSLPPSAPESPADTSGSKTNVNGSTAGKAGTAGSAGSLKPRAKAKAGSDFGRSLAQAFASKTSVKKESKSSQKAPLDKQAPSADTVGCITAAQTLPASVKQDRSEAVRQVVSGSAGQGRVQPQVQGRAQPQGKGRAQPQGQGRAQPQGQGTSQATQSRRSTDKRLHQEHWPTPTAAEWNVTQTVAARICATLEWLNSSAQINAFKNHYSRPHSAVRTRNLNHYTDLVTALFTLLHELVIGHVLDPKLNASKLPLVALKPVIAYWCLASTPQVPADSQFCIAQLGRALLQQLAVDRSTLAKRYEAVESEQEELRRELYVLFKLFELLCKLQGFCAVRRSRQMCTGLWWFSLRLST